MYQLTKRNHQCRTSSVRNKIKWNFIYCVLLFFSLGNQKRTNPLFRWCKNVTYCNQLQINSENITISSSNQEITPFPYLTNTNLLWSDSYGYSYYCSIIRKKDSASISDIWYSILSFSFSFFFFFNSLPSSLQKHKGDAHSYFDCLLTYEPKTLCFTWHDLHVNVANIHSGFAKLIPQLLKRNRTTNLEWELAEILLYSTEF